MLSAQKADVDRLSGSAPAPARAGGPNDTAMTQEPRTALIAIASRRPVGTQHDRVDSQRTLRSLVRSAGPAALKRISRGQQSDSCQRPNSIVRTGSVGIRTPGMSLSMLRVGDLLQLLERAIRRGHLVEIELHAA